MSPLGIQRTIAFLIFFSPWIYVPTIFKEVVFIVAGILLFLSTLDIRRTAKQKEADRQAHPSEEVKTEPAPVHPHIPSI
jgi:hypothetical protein